MIGGSTGLHHRGLRYAPSCPAWRSMVSYEFSYGSRPTILRITLKALVIPLIISPEPPSTVKAATTPGPFVRTPFR